MLGGSGDVGGEKTSWKFEGLRDKWKPDGVI